MKSVVCFLILFVAPAGMFIRSYFAWDGYEWCGDLEAPQTHVLAVCSSKGSLRFLWAEMSSSPRVTVAHDQVIYKSLHIDRLIIFLQASQYALSTPNKPFGIVVNRQISLFGFVVESQSSNRTDVTSRQVFASIPWWSVMLLAAVAPAVRGVRAIRAQRRRRRGLCHNCAYDLSGLPANRCPECGTEIAAFESKPSPH